MVLTSSKRLRIDHLIHISDEAAQLPTFDDLADTACDLLDLCRRSGLSGLEVGPETKMIELAIEERNYTRLEKLIARINAKLQHGSVGASSAPQESAASAAIARHSEPDTSSVAEPQYRIQTHNATLLPLATYPTIPAPYPAIRTNPEHYAEHASLATAYHVAPKNRRGPKPRPNILVTTAGVSSSRPYSTSCKYAALRQFAFDHGRMHLRNGSLHLITIKSIIAA
jgi:hypothetical protein